MSQPIVSDGPVIVRCRDHMLEMWPASATFPPEPGVIELVRTPTKAHASFAVFVCSAGYPLLAKQRHRTPIRA